MLAPNPVKTYLDNQTLRITQKEKELLAKFVEQGRYDNLQTPLGKHIFAFFSTDAKYMKKHLILMPKILQICLDTIKDKDIENCGSAGCILGYMQQFNPDYIFSPVLGTLFYPNVRHELVTLEMACDVTENFLLTGEITWPKEVLIYVTPISN